MSAIYRVQQFLRATGARAQPAAIEDATAARYLPADALALFRAMPGYDRRHALSVLVALQRAGQADPDLMAAALLHDIGKTALRGGELRLWHRVAVVLLHALSPRLLLRLGSGASPGWRRPFAVQVHHAQIGAELAAKAGCSARTVELIRNHEDVQAGASDPLLAQLQSADGMN